MTGGEVGPVPVAGHADGEFAPLTEVLARLVGGQGGGAALAIVRNGRTVVDLVAGDYRPDSVQLLFSVSKSVTAIAAAVLQAEGALDLDAPLHEAWPEFDRAATRSITVRQVLGHRSGLAAFDRELSFEQLLLGEDEAAVEVQDPYWEPDTAHGYHAFTFGTLMNGVFKRVLGRTVGEVVAERLSRPLGLDLWIGAPEEVLPRLERITYRPAVTTALQAEHAAHSRIPPSASGRLQQTMDLYNHPAVATACWPSTSGTGTARSLARLYGATLAPVDGIRLLAEDSRRRMVETRSAGADRTLGFITAFGSGVQRPFPQFPMLGRASFGHEAAGGSVATADDELGLAVGYTTNVFPASRGADSTWLALQQAIRYCALGDGPVR